MSDLPFEYPVIAFQRSYWRGASPSDELLEVYSGPSDFEVCEESALRRRLLEGMVLIDAGGRSWRVEAVRKIGSVGAPWRRVLLGLMRQNWCRVAWDIVETDPVSLEDVKARAVTSIQQNPFLWCDEEEVAGEAGPPVEEAVLLAPILAGVHGASSVAEVVAALGPVSQDRPVFD